MPSSNAARRAKTAAEKLTPKERVVVSEILQGSTAQAALISAGYAANTARANSAEVVGKPRIVQAMNAALEAAGLTTEYLARHAKDGLEATRRQYHEGNCIDETPDFGNRHKYFNTVLELAGHLKRQQDQDSEDGWEGMLLAVRRRQGGNQGDRGQLEE